MEGGLPLVIFCAGAEVRVHVVLGGWRPRRWAFRPRRRLWLVAAGKIKVGDKLVAIFSSDMDKPVYLRSEMTVEDVQHLLDSG